MSREILFKAKRIDNGEWVEGGYFSEPYTDKKFIICWNSMGLGFNEFIEIYPDTLCQYTGLTDKNGKKIWENDIVRNKKGDIGVAQWFEEHAAFMIWNKTKNCVCYLAENDFSKIEVNGNVFDNLELLEAKE